MAVGDHSVCKMEPATPKTGKGSKPNLDDWKREKIFRSLLEASCLGKLPPGAVSNLAAEYKVSPQTIYRIWNRGRTPGIGKYGSVKSKRPGNCGRKLAYPDLLAKITAVAPKHRSTLRDLADAINVPKSVLHERYKKAFFRKYSRPLKPILTPANMYIRSKWALSFISADLIVSNMDNFVHVDEKWFFLKGPKMSFYGVPGETPPPRKVQNKNHILKV